MNQPLDDTPATLYLDLMKRTLTRFIFAESTSPLGPPGSTSVIRKVARRLIARSLAKRGLELRRHIGFDPEARAFGRDWPVEAETMIGLRRLDNLQHCIETILRDDIPGDLIETGVWRGGASIFMRAVLKAYGDSKRVVWCADSFQGLPAPDVHRYPADAMAWWHKSEKLAVPLHEVMENFRRYRLLDAQVRFLEGWFKDTLPRAPIDHLSVLRLDGDMYESTSDALGSLYDKLSPGGFVIVDDYGLPEDTCRRAVHDFRDSRGITDAITDIDGIGAFWRRTG